MQSLTDRASDTHTSPEPPQTLPEEDMVSNLLSSVVAHPTGDGSLLSQQRTVFHTEDGQILYVTYTVNPALGEVNATRHSSASETSQRMVLRVTDDGSTFILPTENVELGGLDIESGLVPQLTVNGMYSLGLSEESLTSPLLQTSGIKNIFKDEEKLKQHPFVQINNRRRTEQVCGFCHFQTVNERNRF